MSEGSLMGKRILFLGRTTAPFKTRRDIGYVIQSLVDNGAMVHLYDPNLKILYDFQKNHIIPYSIIPKILMIGPLRLMWNFLVLIRFCILNKGAYDVVQLNYIRLEYVFIPGMVKRLGGKLFILVYGSDVNRENIFMRWFKGIFNLSDRIICTNPVLAEKVQFRYLPKSDVSKMKVLFLPQDHFNLYADLGIEYKKLAKRKLNISEDKVVLTIGTNVTQNEQHEEIIESISQFADKSYTLIFPLTNTYGGETERELKIENLIKSKLKDFDFHILKGFLSYEEMRDIRFASDVFVNFRKNDQMAVSMLESVLAYNYIISGSWLPYTDFATKVNMVLVDKIDQLESQLKILISDIMMLQNNRVQVLKHYHADVMNDWKVLYA